MNYLYFNLSGIYSGKDNVVDLTDIAGTNCYCDNIAKSQIRKRLDSISDIPQVRFIDSGNYHYMSLFFMERINAPFDLILLDNHPDYKLPSFGNITSCGGWVREAVETFNQIDHVYICGADEKLIEEVSPLPDKVISMSLAQSYSFFYTNNDRPVYISLDKDIMGMKYARTDWSQGNASIDDILSVINIIYEHRNVSGIDICGEKKENPSEEDIGINENTNARILKALESFYK